MLVIFMMSLKWTIPAFSQETILSLFIGSLQEYSKKICTSYVFTYVSLFLMNYVLQKLQQFLKQTYLYAGCFLLKKCIENTQVSLHNNSFVKGDYLHDIVFPLMVMTSVGSLLLQLWKKSFKNSTRLNLSELTFTDIFMTLILRKKTNKDASSLLTALSTVLWLNFTEVRLLTVDTVVNLTDFYNSSKLQSVVWLS